LLGTQSDAALAEKFKRNRTDVMQQRQRLNIPAQKALKPWNRKEEQLLGTASD
jgi:hypothetical protein